MISIIDDDVYVRDALVNCVRSRGYRVAAFGSAEDFLDSDECCRTTCLVLDIHLPGLSGIELQLRMRAEGRTTPVIFITAVGDECVRTRALAAGAAAFLRKPFDGAALSRCLDQALLDRMN